jgi:hypothetical protein
MRHLKTIGLGFAATSFVFLVYRAATDNPSWKYSAVFVIIGLLVAVLGAVGGRND